MRIRASNAVVGGALALSALAVPAAQASGSEGDSQITTVVVDGDNMVAIGSSAVTFKVSVTATDDSGIKGADAFHLHGPGDGHATTDEPVCTQADATTSTCTASVTIDPKTDHLTNANAGTWYVDARVDANDGDHGDKEKAGFFHLQRAARLSVPNASPEPVKRGSTVTVTGVISRANWETLGTSAKLQYRRKTENSYTTLKSTGQVDDGRVKTTTPATYDGYYRLAYPGNWITPDVSSSGDYVDVR
ncbi:calcium-binding protein [Streptomyces cinerochromogenes]|uniref:calcium-binding protein n=1 Tax=Streptomyces cinerochromogenes TaxID=66422 RepID=UPI00368D3560